MKRFLISFALGVATFALLAFTKQQSEAIYIVNTTPNETKLKIRGASQTHPWIEVLDGDTLVFQVPATGIIPVLNGGTGGTNGATGLSALGLEKGTASTGAGTTTTQAFSTVYSTIPVVTVTGGTNSLAHVISITTSNVIFGVTVANTNLQWIAVGAR